MSGRIVPALIVSKPAPGRFVLDARDHANRPAAPTSLGLAAIANTCSSSLLTRHRATDDKRSHVIRLTPHGKRLTKRLLDLHARLERDMAERLGQGERDRLLRLLGAFRRLDTAPELGEPG